MMATAIESPLTDAAWLPVTAIEANPHQPRRSFAPQELEELAASIAERGVLQPILVRPVSGKKHKGVLFQLVLGERRWRAAQQAGLREIPARVQEMDDLAAAVTALTENIQRADLSDYDEALALENLIKQSAEAGEPLSERALARQLGKSVGYVRNKLSLRKMKPDVQELAARHNGVMSSCFEINTLPDATDRRELIELVDKGAAFTVVKAEVQKRKQEAQWKRESQTPDRATQQALNRLDQREREAQQQAEAALAQAETALMSAASWLEEAPASYREQTAQPRIERIYNRVQRLRANSP